MTHPKPQYFCKETLQMEEFADPELLLRLALNQDLAEELIFGSYFLTVEASSESL